ncbi:hypothetical protein J6590_004843 [Homalodisca vitripennis]|nr:hypothetical protein J6590_004843 [Homalodisca vitripennis]
MNGSVGTNRQNVNIVIGKALAVVSEANAEAMGRAVQPQRRMFSILSNLGKRGIFLGGDEK